MGFFLLASFVIDISINAFLYEKSSEHVRDQKYGKEYVGFELKSSAVVAAVTQSEYMARYREGSKKTSCTGWQFQGG